MFLPNHYQLRTNRKYFSRGNVEKDVALPILSGEELYNEVSKYKGIVFCFYFGKRKFHGFNVIYNWIK